MNERQRRPKARKTLRARNSLPQLPTRDSPPPPDAPAGARVGKGAKPPDVPPRPGTPVPTDVFTLKNLITSFTAEVELLVRAGTLAPKTRDWYAGQFKHLRALEGFPADALRVTHLAGIELTNAFCRALKKLYKWAAEEDLLEKNPFRKLVVPPCGQRERVLTRGELCRLYRAAPRAFRRLLFVQLHTIARPGEIRQLVWEQIDWKRRVIVLVDFKGKKRRRDKVKERLIPLPEIVVRLLRNLHRKSPDPSPAGRVFRSTRGNKPWSYNGTRCAMLRARAAAGLDVGDEPVVCYHLRHTSATEAVRAGENLKLVAEMMGHSRTSTTERYVHLEAEDIVGAIDRLAAHVRRRRIDSG
jgi:integrase